MRNAIAFAMAAPVAAPAGSTWIIQLDCLAPQRKQCTLGRFRLSVTNGPVTRFETALHKVLAEGERNGRTRLGMVYYLREDWPAAAAVLRIAADAPEATGIDHFLLALALHRLKRHDEARRALEAGVAWLKQDPTSDTLRTLVVEAVAAIEAIGRGQAEARIFLDRNFPADPFAP